MNIKYMFSTVEYHVGGAPARIVTSGCPPILGKTMTKKTEFVRERLDFVREITMEPPRGDPGMMGAILTDPCTEDADVGVVFMDINGYPNLCGHVSMAVGRLVLEQELSKWGVRGSVKLDTAAGIVSAKRMGSEIFFTNVPSFKLFTTEIVIPKVGKIPIDVCFGGDFFAMVDADVWGLDMMEASIDEKVNAGRVLFDAVEKLEVAHPEYRKINKIDVVMIYQKGEPYYRSVVVSDGGYWDRCPCGSGTSALMALLHSRGELKVDEPFGNMSPTGSVFKGTLLDEVRVGSLSAVIPDVVGRPYVIGLNRWVAERGDGRVDGYRRL